ncbi:hypothetical protein, partial [Pseudomonas juntendi]|uniref:hypothetical protein n=1 Tax=Pseudomonas juntendi TaxID=2666183 RepID=UPI00345CBB6F
SSISRSEASAGGADVGQRAIGCAGEVQEVAEDVLDALQRYFSVGVWHFTKVEEQVVEGCSGGPRCTPGTPARGLYLPGHYQLKINGSGALIDKVQYNYWAKLTSSVSRLHFLY